MAEVAAWQKADFGGSVSDDVSGYSEAKLPRQKPVPHENGASF